MADLLTLAEYKSLNGVNPTDTRTDAEVEAMLPTVSRLIRTYTDREFMVSDGSATPRTYQYDNSGFLDIGDCTSVTSVVTDGGSTGQTIELQPDQWTAMPYGGDVIYYLLVGGGPFNGMSPEMGFERNLDTMPWRPVKFPMITVTATWGWPSIPSDIKLAAAWTIKDWLSKPPSDGLTAEAIEGYSRAWGAKSGSGPSPNLAIPNKARDILANYDRVQI